MGNSSCKSCPKEKEHTKDPQHGSDPRKYVEDIKIYLRPPPLNIHPDPTPLNMFCTCSRKGFKRSQCLTCIKSYVWAVTYETAEADIQRLKDNKQIIAAERVELELIERKRKEL